MRPSRFRSAPTPKGTRAETKAKKAAAKRGAASSPKAKLHIANEQGAKRGHQTGTQEKARCVDPERLVRGDNRYAAIVAMLADQLRREPPSGRVERR
jgi:hypothetical protein